MNEIAIIRKGENDLNAQFGKEFNPELKQAKTYYLPAQILELSFIVRGEAGGGKTVFLDRLMKETIDAGHSVILHNVKGDELEKIAGYKSYYQIEPWTPHTWEIDFLNLCADEDEDAEDAKIRTLAQAFSKVPEEFFDKASITVVEALIRSVIKSNKDKDGKVQATLEKVVNTWHDFNVDEEQVKVDMTDIEQVKKAVKQESEQLKKINEFLKQWFKTSAMYIDPKNEKTSLCVLASVVEIVRKFESLSNFWNKNAIDRNTGEKRIFNISKWVETKKERPVIILSNSNMFGDVANSYISAFINLIVTKLIDSNYKPVKEIHFILDEFVQLSSINLNDFMKLPDVGRGKNVRVKIAFQRTSQVREAWPNADPKSFASAFQNKIWARFADDDKDNLRHEIGKQKVTTYKTSVNWNAQGRSISNQTETKVEEVTNVDELQKKLGPVKMYMLDKKTGKRLPNPKTGIVEPWTVGVSIFCNFSNCRALSVIKFPFVNFEKRKNKKFDSKASSSNVPVATSNDSKDQKEDIEKEILENIKNSVEIQNNTKLMEKETEEKSISEGVGSEFIAEALDHTGILSTAMKVAEVVEALENHTQNSNVAEVKSEISDEDLEQLIKEFAPANNKNKEKTK